MAHLPSQFSNDHPAYQRHFKRCSRSTQPCGRAFTPSNLEGLGGGTDLSVADIEIESATRSRKSLSTEDPEISKFMRLGAISTEELAKSLRRHSQLAGLTGVSKEEISEQALLMCVEEAQPPEELAALETVPEDDRAYPLYKQMLLQSEEEEELDATPNLDEFVRLQRGRTRC